MLPQLPLEPLECILKLISLDLRAVGQCERLQGHVVIPDKGRRFLQLVLGVAVALEEIGPLLEGLVQAAGRGDQEVRLSVGSAWPRQARIATFRRGGVVVCWADGALRQEIASGDGGICQTTADYSVVRVSCGVQCCIEFSSRCLLN